MAGNACGVLVAAAGLELLYDLAEIKQDFQQLEIKKLGQTEINLNEGEFHQGLANVIRLIGIKPLS